MFIAASWDSTSRIAVENRSRESTATGANAVNNANTSSKTATGQIGKALTYNGWVGAEYNSQSSPGTFITMGSESCGNPGTYALSQLYHKASTRKKP